MRKRAVQIAGTGAFHFGVIDQFSLSAAAVAPLEVRLSWSDVGAPADTVYQIERSDGVGGWYRIGSASVDRKQYTDWGRTPNTLYTYRLRSSNSTGLSGYSAAVAATTIAGDGAGEFVGPLAGWANVKAAPYNAVGNGIADDRAAIQSALTDLNTRARGNMLYVPAGTYRLGSPLTTTRVGGSDGTGISIIGEDPATTTLKWAGAAGGTMLLWDAQYSSISRLTFDGAGPSGNAGIGLLRDGLFSTSNEVVDCTFKDMATGTQFGGASGNGIAETELLRCSFLRCSNAGIVVNNANSLDIWAWYCHFQGCAHGMRAITGNFHAWYNLFQGQTVSDIMCRTLSPFSFVRNVSIGSPYFVDDSDGTWGAPTSILENRIINWNDAADSPPNGFGMWLSNRGPYLVMDNMFGEPTVAQNSIIDMGTGESLFYGNLFARPTSNAVTTRGTFRRLDEEQVAVPLDPNPPYLPQTPPKVSRTIFEVATGANAATIQAAINNAAAAASKSVVHVPAGTYNIATGLSVPANSDLQLIGDGASDLATRLTWTGSGAGPMLHVIGPSKATLRHFQAEPGTANGIVIDGADQAGGSVWINQVAPLGRSPASKVLAGLQVAGVENADVTALGLLGRVYCQKAVQVIGGTQQQVGNQTSGRVGIYMGATATSDLAYSVESAGRLLVHAEFHEMSDAAPQAVNLTDSGSLVIVTTRFSYQNSATTPLIAVNGFHGDLLLTAGVFQPVASTVTGKLVVSGSGANARVLMAANQFSLDESNVTSDFCYADSSSPPATSGMVLCNGNYTNAEIALGMPDYLSLADRGLSTDAHLRSMLGLLRQSRVSLPGGRGSGVTDVLMHRVTILGDLGSVALKVAA